MQCTAIPLLETRLAPASFSADAIHWLAKNAVKRGAVSAPEAERWRAELRRREQQNSYFFSLNRFLFTAVKQAPAPPVLPPDH